MKSLQLDNQICFPIYSASRLITKAYKPFLDKMGLTYPQYLVLLVLWENNKISINKISKALLLNTNTLSPLLKRMEKMDLLQRNRSIEDERIVVIELTEKGEELKNQAALIPEELIKILISEDIELSEIIGMKNMLNELIKILSNKK